MSAIVATKAPAFDFTYHLAAAPYSITQQSYLSANPGAKCDNLATGAFVFDQSNPHTPRILLVQRAAADSMPNRWETPGGGCDDDDESILHAVTRELWEEAGLKARYIGAPVGDPHYFSSRSGKRICKFNFVVQVEADASGNLVPVLDPAEHQQFVWASEVEVKLKKVDDIELVFTTKDLENTILLAFRQL